MTSDLPIVLSGFYTGVTTSRHRIFELHQSYLRVSGAGTCYVYCTGPRLADRYRLTMLHYLDRDTHSVGPVSTLSAMAREGAQLAEDQGLGWVILTHGDIWGPKPGWASSLIALGLAQRPDAAMIGFPYGPDGYVGRLLALRPAAAVELFDADHAARYDAACAYRARPPVYEQYLFDRTRELNLSRYAAILPAASVRKKATWGSRSRTAVPAHPLLRHDHSHIYDYIRHKWYHHRPAQGRG